MNQRIIKITTSINKLAISDNEKLTQGDKNTHFIDIKFLDDINLTGYQLLVLYKLPFPDETVLVDTYNSLQTEMKLLIPNHALMKSGELTVEFALKKEKELITINKNLTLEVISTVNAAYVEEIQLGDTTKQTIAEQIEKLTTLLAQAQTEIDRYDKNVSNKTNEFDKHVEASKASIDDYIEAKKPELKGADGKDGAPGKNGVDGRNGVDGEDGAIFTPSVDSKGNLSWSNDKNLPNPPTVNIQGPPGPAGEGGGSGGVDPSNLLEKGNLPSTFANAETIVNALQANTGMKFDEGLLYLNDSGTKKKGYCYIDKLTDGIFECIQETTTTVNNATYFKNFSNKENSDRLSNLFGYSILKKGYISEINVKTRILNLYADNCEIPASRADLMELIIVLRSDYKNPQERAKFIKIAATAEPGNAMKVIYDFGHTYGKPSETATQIEILTNEHAVYATAKEFPMYYTIYGLVFKNY